MLFVILFWVMSSSFIFLLSAGWSLCTGDVEKDNAISHYCRGLWTNGRSKGLYARTNVVPCDLSYSCLPLSFHLGGAAVVVTSLIGTMVFWLGLYCKGFLPSGRVSPRTSLFSRHSVYLPMYWWEPGRVSVWSLQKWRLRVSVGRYWSDYTTSYRVCLGVCCVCVLACMAFPLHFFHFFLLSFIPSWACSNL